MTTQDVTDTHPQDLLSSPATPGLEHLWILKWLDRTGLPPSLIAFGCFISLTVIAVIMLIIVGFPDPAMYRNSIAFTAIIGFFLCFYFAMGRGWYRDMLTFIEFDPSLESETDNIQPSRISVRLEVFFAVICASINLYLNDDLSFEFSKLLVLSIFSFYVIEYVLIILSMDVVFRQLALLVRLVKKIRIDLLNTEFYSALANVMVRHVGLYISGVCIISLSYIVFTEGELGPSEMLVAMMPWYLPGMLIISLYLVPYNLFRKRMRFYKLQEMNSIAAALAGNPRALDHSLLKDEPVPSKIDLLYYQDRIRAIKEWPFTDRIRALVLFGILPPLTWVIAALIEIMIEGAI
jgi:hypothetical protein